MAYLIVDNVIKFPVKEEEWEYRVIPEIPSGGFMAECGCGSREFNLFSHPLEVLCAKCSSPQRGVSLEWKLDT